MPETPPNTPNLSPENHQKIAVPLAARIALAQRYGQAETVPGESQASPENKDQQIRDIKEQGHAENGASPLSKKASTDQDSDSSDEKP